MSSQNNNNDNNNNQNLRLSQTMRNDIKVIVIGSSGTGKTSFVQRWLKQEFTENYKPTIITEFGFKIFEYEQNFFRVQLWDIGGQDKSTAVTKIFAKDSHGCLVFSDVTNEETLEEALIWKQLVEDECKFTDGGKIPFLLIQNKIDLIEEEEKIKKIEEHSKKFYTENEFENCFLCSAKTNINVEESMNFFLEHIIKRLITYLNEGNEDINTIEYRKSIRLSNSGASSKDSELDKKKCCQ